VAVSVSVSVVCLTAHQFRCQVQQVQLGDGTALDVHGGSQRGGDGGVPQLVVPRFQLGVDRCLAMSERQRDCKAQRRESALSPPSVRGVARTSDGTGYRAARMAPVREPVER